MALRIATRYHVAVVQEVLLGYRRRPGSMSSACDTMWRSPRLVMKGIRNPRPELKARLFWNSANQFAMYLAGVSYWSGNMKAACRRRRLHAEAVSDGVEGLVVPHRHAQKLAEAIERLAGDRTL